MRLVTVTSFSVAMLASVSAWSAPNDPVPEQRSAIEWLISDIGALFSAASEELSSSASTPSPEGRQIPFQPVVNIDQDLFGEANFDTPVVAHDPTASRHPDTTVAADKARTNKRPSIGDLFADLLSFIRKVTDQPASPVAVAGVAHTPEAASGVSEHKAEVPETRAEPEPVVVSSVDTAQQQPDHEEFDLFAVLEQAAVAYEETEDDAPSRKEKPLLSDFFASLGGDKKTIETDDVALKHAEDETADHHIDQQSASGPHNPLAADIASEPTETSVSVRTVAATDLERAPWQVNPHVAVFAPNVDVFDETQPVPAISTPAQTRQVASVEVRDIGTTIRKRQPRNPAARNHLSLGHAEASDAREDEFGFFDHLIETFIGEDTESASEQEVLANKIPDRIVPEEALDLGYVGPDSAPLDEPKDEVTTIGDGVLKHVDLYLGQDTVIGRPYEASAHNPDACIERALQVSIFCIAKIAWPSEIATSFSQDTAFTLPGEGVIRYENGLVSRAYSPFRASDFAEVVKFMQRRFGPPLEREVIWMHMIEAPKMPNTTFRWRAISADRKDSIVLEVRNYDDLRRSFADLNRGMVRLYRDGSRPIFKHLSTMDLMLIQRRRISQAPVSSDGKPATN